MKYTFKREKNKLTVSFTTDADEFKAAEMEAYQKEKGKYNVPGFRKGKAPKHIIENAYGPVFIEGAMDNLIEKGYGMFLEENTELYPIDKPSADIKNYDVKDFKFDIFFTVTPEVELCDYKGLTIPKIEYPVKDSDVEEELKRVQERAATYEEIEKAEKGDTCNIDYAGTVDGVAFDGGTAQGYDLELGSNSFIPGFEDQLIGSKKGDEVDVKVKFPEDYHAENLKGKDAVFKCKVNKVTRKVLPEINDELAKDSSEFDNLEDYKKSIKEKIAKSNAEREKQEKENAVIEAVVNASKADIPECLVNDTVEELYNDFAQRLAYQGMKIEDYLSYVGMTKEQYNESNKENAKKRAMTRLCMSEIIKREKLEATDEEGNAKYAEEMKKYSPDEEVKPVEGRVLEYYKEAVIMDKMFDILLASAKEGAAAEKPAKKAAKKEEEKKEEPAEEKPAKKVTKKSTKKAE